MVFHRYAVRKERLVNSHQQSWWFTNVKLLARQILGLADQLQKLAAITEFVVTD